MAGVLPPKTEQLSPLARWFVKFSHQHNIIDTSLNALNFEPEPMPAHLLGDRYLDLSLCLVFAVALPLARRLLRFLVADRLGHWMVYGGDPKKTDVKVDPEKLRKWHESFWKMSVYITFVAVAYLVSYKERWFTDSRFMWLGCNQFPPCNLAVSRGVLLFYCLETGYYLQAIHYLIFIETRRKDWLESMAHHIITSALLFYSYAVNFTRVGMVILLIHDVCDIFLEFAKICRYARDKAWRTPATVSFVIFFLSWIVFRCIIFPFFVLRATLFEPVVLIAAFAGIEPRPHWEIFNALLLILQVLNIYWTWMIWLVIKRSLSSKSLTDVREDGSDDDD